MGRIPSVSVPPWPWLFLHDKELPRQGITASFFLTPLPSPISPGKGFPQPGGGSGCSCFWERVSGVHGAGIAHGCSPKSDGSSSSEPPPLPLSAPARIRGGKILLNFISHFDPHFLYTETFKICPLRAATTKKSMRPANRTQAGAAAGGCAGTGYPPVAVGLQPIEPLCTLITHLRAQGRAGSDLGSSPTVTSPASLCHAASRTSRSKDHGR